MRVFSSESKLLIHGIGAVLAHDVGGGQDLHPDELLAELQLQHVAHLHILGGLHRPSVGGDTACVTGLVGHGAPLDEAGDLQPFVQSHSILLK